MSLESKKQIVESETEQLLISIIIPCYNSAKYLGEAIESILIQSYSNWECIIIDDHSKDNSYEIAKTYSFKYPSKITSLLNIGTGACDARNYGISLSKGSCLKFLDSDDAIFESNVLQEQVDLLRKYNCDVVYGEEFYYKETLSEKQLIKKRGSPINSETPKTFYYNFPITSNFLIKKNSLCFKWNNRLKSGQEFFLLFQCYLKGLIFKYQPIPTCKIRVHDSVDRISNKPRVKYYLQVYELYGHMLKEIQKHEGRPEALQEFKKQLLLQSYHAIKFKSFEAAGLMQSLLGELDKTKVSSLKEKIVFYFNSISPYLGYGLYKVFTLKGREL